MLAFIGIGRSQDYIESIMRCFSSSLVQLEDLFSPAYGAHDGREVQLLSSQEIAGDCIKEWCKDSEEGENYVVAMYHQKMIEIVKRQGQTLTSIR